MQGCQMPWRGDTLTAGQSTLELVHKMKITQLYLYKGKLKIVRKNNRNNNVDIVTMKGIAN